MDYLTAKSLLQLAADDRRTLEKAFESKAIRDAINETRAMCSVPQPRTLDDKVELMKAFFIMSPRAKFKIAAASASNERSSKGNDADRDQVPSPRR